MVRQVKKLDIPMVVIPKDGDLVSFEVKDIQIGKLVELLDKNTSEKWEYSDPNDTFVRVLASNQTYGEVSCMIPVVLDTKGNIDNNKINFRSTLAMLRHTYKKDLEIGMTLEFEYHKENKNFRLVV